jgi:hypothetical protein
LLFPKKLKAERCPTCTQEIFTYGPEKSDYKQLLALQEKDVANSELDLIGENLDHKFFAEEI